MRLRSDQTRLYDVLLHNAIVLEPVQVMYLRNSYKYAKTKRDANTGKALTDQDLRYHSGL